MQSFDFDMKKVKSIYISDGNDDKKKVRMFLALKIFIFFFWKSNVPMDLRCSCLQFSKHFCMDHGNSLVHAHILYANWSLVAIDKLH